MDTIERLVEELGRTRNGNILTELNHMGVSIIFLSEGIRWKYRK
ncbi:hypothetical protein [Bacillus sp. sid0103]|nr:hypothetical protein [Bacillus sp. sid0103]